MQRERSYNKLNNVLIHVMVWAVLGLYFYRQLFFTDSDIPKQYWIKQTATLSLLVITFYLNSLVLVPRLLFKNHLVLYIVIIVAIMAAITFLNRWIENALSPFQFALDEFIHHSPGSGMSRLRLRQPRVNGLGYQFRLGDLFTLIISGLVVGISTTMTAIQKWQKDNQERKELEKDKITAELSTLKAQINPHFFFNTLNNIYALTTVDPKVAGEAIHELSKMMRYLLYDTQTGDTLLSKEIAFVKHYISLMQLRLTEVVKINIDIQNNLTDMPLAPMILLPFIENAFKHGISATRESHIDIIISQKDKLLDLVVNNSIMKNNSISLDKNSGIGLLNTRRRLELLYPGKHKLEIGEKGNANQYNVHLVLDLS